jgi:hypothetical protein
MRTLLAIGVVMGGLLALNGPADADRDAKRIEAKRIAKSHAFAAQPRDAREAVECERALHADPTGLYAAYPCWACEVLSPDSGGDRP